MDLVDFNQASESALLSSKLLSPGKTRAMKEYCYVLRGKHPGVLNMIPCSSDVGAHFRVYQNDKRWYWELWGLKHSGSAVAARSRTEGYAYKQSAMRSIDSAYRAMIEVASNWDTTYSRTSSR